MKLLDPIKSTQKEVVLDHRVRISRLEHHQSISIFVYILYFRIKSNPILYFSQYIKDFYVLFYNSGQRSKIRALPELFLELMEFFSFAGVIVYKHFITV